MHNEAANVAPLCAELAAALAPMAQTAELIFVDDGSTDETFARLREAHERARQGGERSPPVKVLRLRRRFGKASALAAGFAEARGEAIITLDGDLQDDPKEIPRFLASLDDGLDLVSGWKRKRHDPLGKVLPSRLFNFVVALVTGIRLHDFNCGFKAYRAEVIREIRLYGGLHRFIPVLAHAKGFRVGEIEIAHRPRARGRSKYGVARLATGFLDLLTVLVLTGYGSRPLHLFGGTGVVSLLGGAGVGLYLFVLWLSPANRPLGSRPLLTLTALLIIVGVQLISVGLIGEMIASRQRDPRETYSVAERLEEASRGES